VFFKDNKHKEKILWIDEVNTNISVRFNQ